MKSLFKLAGYTLFILVVLAFIGVEPLASYKSNMLIRFNSYTDNTTSPAPDNTITTTITPSITPTTITPGTIAPTPSATKVTLKDPSLAELGFFLGKDKTDELLYVYPIFVCDNFARTLQRNANKEGWRCARLSVELKGYPDFYDYGIPSNSGHALNAFNTTDGGLIYVDCTGVPSHPPYSCDKIVNVEVGKDYIPVSILPDAGWSSYWDNMGKIVSIGTLYW